MLLHHRKGGEAGTHSRSQVRKFLLAGCGILCRAPIFFCAAAPQCARSYPLLGGLGERARSGHGPSLHVVPSPAGGTDDMASTTGPNAVSIAVVLEENLLGQLTTFNA